MITNSQIENIVSTIVAGYKPEKIILFGSYAYGNPDKDSDIDLLIIKNGEKPGLEKNRFVRSLLKDLLIPVDIIIKNSEEFNMLKDVLGTIIYPAAKYGKVLYG